MAVTAGMDPALGTIRARLGGSAATTLVGIFVCALGEPGLGGWMVVGSMAVLIASLHRLGRTGPA